MGIKIFEYFLLGKNSWNSSSILLIKIRKDGSSKEVGGNATDLNTYESFTRVGGNAGTGGLINKSQWVQRISSYLCHYHLS